MLFNLKKRHKVLIGTKNTASERLRNQGTIVSLTLAAIFWHEKTYKKIIYHGLGLEKNRADCKYLESLLEVKILSYIFIRVSKSAYFMIIFRRNLLKWGSIMLLS